MGAAAVTATPISGRLFGRKVGLLCYNPLSPTTSPSVSPATGSNVSGPNGQASTAASNNALDLSDMHIVFRVEQGVLGGVPTTAAIKIHNLSQKTSQLLGTEFQRVSLQAGYQGGPYGTIFDGTIKQIVFGVEDGTTSFATIYAADGDVEWTNGMVSTSLAAANTSKQQQLDAISQAIGLPQGYTMDMPPQALARGKVLFGNAHDLLDNLTVQLGNWTIDKGQLVVVGLTDYRPGEAVVLSPSSGLISIPEQTAGGIEARALLNPNLVVGGLVQIAGGLINEGLSAAPQNPPPPGRLELLPGYNARISNSGLYKILVSQFSGDTRGEEWWVDLTCLAVDPSAPAGQQVNPNA
jgi:hypothetical protein